jgi:hypothetical protein
MKNYLPEFKNTLDPVLLSIDGVRPGLMFGCPAYYAAGGLAVCHYNDNFFVKLPGDIAAHLITNDPQASANGPMGQRRSMGKNWVFLHVPDLAALGERIELFKMSIAFVATQPVKSKLPKKPKRIAP